MQDKSCILVVDESHTMQRIIRTLLKQIGYENVLEASGPEEAHTILKTQKVDVIIADAIMPKAQGLALLRTLRGNGNSQATAVILVTTASEKKQLSEEVKDLECVLITRPFSVQGLKERLGKMTQSEKSKVKHTA